MTAKVPLCVQSGRRAIAVIPILAVIILLCIWTAIYGRPDPIEYAQRLFNSELLGLGYINAGDRMVLQETDRRDVYKASAPVRLTSGEYIEYWELVDGSAIFPPTVFFMLPITSDHTAVYDFEKQVRRLYLTGKL